MKVAIGIPVYVNVAEHIDYLNQTTKGFNTSYPYIFIPVINKFSLERKEWEFTQKPDQIIELEGRQPQGVGKAWNDIISRSLQENCDYTIIFNQDIVIAKTAIDNLVAFAESHKEGNAMWTMTESSSLETLNDTSGEDGFYPHFSAYMVDKTFKDAIGQFDENFTPAYFEDNDMHARIVKSGKHAACSKDAKFFHHGSITLRTDSEYRAGHSGRFITNEMYFRQKWGISPVNGESQMITLYYKTPFNEADKELSYWPVGYKRNTPTNTEIGLSGTGLSASTILQQNTEMERAARALRSNQN